MIISLYHFLQNDAIRGVNELGIMHLLVDIPSIDKPNDGGRLGNHRLFFDYGDTISELLYIPDNLLDGFGFLQIQIQNWYLMLLQADQYFPYINIVLILERFTLILK